MRTLLLLLFGCSAEPKAPADSGTDAAVAGPIDLTVSLAPPVDGYQAVTPPFEVPPY